MLSERRNRIVIGRDHKEGAIIPISSPADGTKPNIISTMSSDLARGVRVATTRENPRGRIAALDFTKGTLVLIMVLYHWLNYFHGAYGSVYRYLRFLPPSFIFISGFLISNAYFVKHGAADSRIPKRLMFRGLKILTLFFTLNLAISFVFFGFHNLDFKNLVAVFVTGNVLIVGAGRAAAFYILVPISYLLLLSALLMVIGRFHKYIFYVVCALFLLGIYVLNLNGMASSNLELVAIGLMGLILGYIPIEKINDFTRHPYAIALAFLLYTAAISLREPNYPLQVVGVLLTLMVIYLLGTKQRRTWRSEAAGYPARKIFTLRVYRSGRYSSTVARCFAPRGCKPRSIVSIFSFWTCSYGGSRNLT